MRIATKLGVGFGGITVLLLICAGSGLFAVGELSKQIKYITGPAWNTADGAMEVSIGIKGQMLAVHQLASGDNDPNSAMVQQLNTDLKKQVAFASAAFEQLKDAALIDGDAIKALEVIWNDFNKAEQAFLGQTMEFRRLYAILSENMAHFQAFMHEMELVSDDIVQQLAKNPDADLSRNSALLERWSGANNAMDANIAIMERSYFFERLLSGASDATAMQGLNATFAELDAKVKLLTVHPMFKETPVASGRFAGKTFAEGLSALWTEHQSAMNAAVPAVAKLGAARNEFERIAHALLERITDIEVQGDKAVDGSAHKMEAVEASATVAIMLVTCVSLLGAIIGALLISRAVVRPIAAVVQELKSRENDLTITLPVAGNDEISVFSDAFNRFSQNMRTVVVAAVDSMAQLERDVEQLRNLFKSTQSDTYKQQGEINQIATALNELSASAQDVASSAAQASQATENTDTEIKHGQGFVNRTVAANEALVQEMTESSSVIQSLKVDTESIGAVLDVIREIADQTNLLALNAAIEAARAGEQGRGFAVVADEVRTLAQRTQISTQEIQKTIEKLQQGANQAVRAMELSKEKVLENKQAVTETEQVFSKVTEHIHGLNNMNASIATAAEEQSTVVNDIDRGVMSVTAGVGATVVNTQKAVVLVDGVAKLAQHQAMLVGKFRV